MSPNWNNQRPCDALVMRALRRGRLLLLLLGSLLFLWALIVHWFALNVSEAKAPQWLSLEQSQRPGELPSWIANLFPMPVPDFFRPDRTLRLPQAHLLNNDTVLMDDCSPQIPTTVLVYHLGRPLPIALLCEGDAPLPPLPMRRRSQPAVLLGIYVPQNFAELLFQTLEPLVRLLMLSGVSLSDPIVLLLPGSSRQYQDPVFRQFYDFVDLLFGEAASVHYMADARGSCYAPLWILSQDVHAIYRHTSVTFDETTGFYAGPALYHDSWVELVQRILPTQQPALSGAPILLVSRPVGNQTRDGRHRVFARSLLNEEQILSHLAAHHVGPIQTVHLEELPLLEQIQRVRSAKVLVCVHGAGCTHAIFLPPGSVLLHIAPFMVEHDLYARLALAMGHRCLEYRAKTIRDSVFYSTLFPPECLKHVLAPGAEAPLPRVAMTAAGLPGLSGEPYAYLSSAIRAAPRACRLNDYFWKQQDLTVNPRELAITLLVAQRAAKQSRNP